MHPSIGTVLHLSILCTLLSPLSAAQTLLISEWYRDPPGADIVNTNRDSVEAGEFIELAVLSGGDIDNWKITDFDATPPLAFTAPFNLGARVKALRGSDALVSPGEVILIYLGGGGLHLSDRRDGAVYILYGGAAASSGGLLSNVSSGAGDPLCLMNAAGQAVDFVYYGATNVDIDADLSSDAQWAGWPHDPTNRKALSALSFASLAGNQAAHRTSSDPASAGATAWGGGPPSPGVLPLALPVEVGEFSLRRIGEDVEIAWTTLREENNAGFRVERRRTGEVVWSVVHRTSGAGTSYLRHQYRCLDHPLDLGPWDYRLLQCDWDGEERECAAGHLPSSTATHGRAPFLLPNPASSLVRVEAIPPDATGWVLTTMHGQCIRAELLNSEPTIELDLSPLPMGLYYIQFHSKEYPHPLLLLHF